jgi:hypothetical protein
MKELKKICFYLTVAKNYRLFKVYLLEFDIGRLGGEKSGFDKGAENGKSLGGSVLDNDLCTKLEKYDETRG